MVGDVPQNNIKFSSWDNQPWCRNPAIAVHQKYQCRSIMNLWGASSSRVGLNYIKYPKQHHLLQWDNEIPEILHFQTNTSCVQNTYLLSFITVVIVDTISSGVIDQKSRASPIFLPTIRLATSGWSHANGIAIIGTPWYSASYKPFTPLWYNNSLAFGWPIKEKTFKLSKLPYN